MDKFGFTPEDVAVVGDMASKFMTISEIAVMLDVGRHVLAAAVADLSSEVSRAYRRGKMSSLAKLRSVEMELAMTGSPAAMENIRRYLADMNADECV